MSKTKTYPFKSTSSTESCGQKTIKKGLNIGFSGGYQDIHKASSSNRIYI